MTSSVNARKIERNKLLHDVFISDSDVFVGFAFGLGLRYQLVYPLFLC